MGVCTVYRCMAVLEADRVGKRKELMGKCVEGALVEMVICGEWGENSFCGNGCKIGRHFTRIGEVWSEDS